MNKNEAGFTLVELMIAMIAGAFAVAGVYYLNGVSARSYAQQMAVSDMQMSMRSAMEQIRRDVARAGYLAAPSTYVLRNCLGDLPATGAGPTDNTTHHFQAVTIGTGRSTSYNPTEYATSGADVLKLVGSNPVAFDDLTLFGNFSTADAYLTAPLLMLTDRLKVVLNPSTESFRRSFYTPAANNGAAQPDYTAFTTAFRAGHMVRVEQGGRFYFRQISQPVWTAANLAAPRIELVAALPGCVEPTAWTAVAPVSRIHYGLESDLNPEFARLRASAALPGSRRMLLVRREETTTSLPPTDATSLNRAAGFTAITTIPDTSRIVLDYAVEFGVAAVRNTQTDPARPAWQYAITSGEVQAADALPNRFRSLIVTLSARASEVDPRLGPVGATRRQPATGFLGDPLLTFNVIDPNFASLTTLQARVRTTRAEIFLHNL